MRDKKPTQKVSVKLWRNLIYRLDQKVEAACLRRDSWLSKIIAVEVARLDKDVSVPNSDQASKFISEQLDGLDRKLVTLTLDAAVAERLNEVCAVKSIVRDAFLNRLIFWLVASEKVVDRFLGIGWDSEVRRARLDAGFFGPDTLYPLDVSHIEALVDPLCATHQHFELQRFGNLVASREEGLDQNKPSCANTEGAETLPNFYMSTFNASILKDINLWGLNTYLADYNVPGTREQKEFDGEWELLPLP